MKKRFGFRLNLGIKFLSTLGLVIIITLAGLFIFMGRRQEKQIIDQVDQQARVLFDQIVLTRSWVAAQSGGVYSKIEGEVEPNPYLLEIDGLVVNITDENGIEYTLRNPALVTRELSELAVGQEAYAFHITSLNPLNPNNTATGWESKALISFENGKKESDFIIEESDTGEVYRYMAPLYVKEGCLRCHAQQGYEVGDVRGGISVAIPMADTRAEISANNSELFTLNIAIVGIVLIIIILLIKEQITNPLQKLQEAATAIADGDLDRPIHSERNDEIGQLADSFSTMTRRLRANISDLEGRVALRTQHLEEYSKQLETAATVGRLANTILDANKLQEDIVDIIREEFNLYYVGLFLVDEGNTWAILQAGTGEAGETMLAREHKLRIGEGMIGWSIANAQARVAEEVGKDTIQLATDELPETRSEAAIPLRARGKIIGALSVQDNMQNSFDKETISVLQIMAEQVGIALANSQLYFEAQEALETARRAYGQRSEEAWRDLVSQQVLGFKEDRSGTTPIQSDTDVATENEENLPELKIPIKVHERIIGYITAHKSLQQGDDWNNEESELMEILSEQLSVALESARLFDESQRRATREHVISEASAKMRETLNIETVLETATRELHKALGGMETKIWLDTKKIEQNDD